MKILESIREFLSILGITSSQSMQKYPFNMRNVMCLLWFVTMSISAAIYLAIEAKTAKEYVTILSSSTTIVIMFIEHALHMWKMKKLFEFIVNFENFIQKRLENPKSKLLYCQYNQQVEKWTKTLIFAMMNVTRNFVLFPSFIASYFTYFTTDLRSEAFYMEFFFWYPFDWKDPFGYLVAFALEYIIGSYIVGMLVCQTCLIIGSYWLMISLAKDLSRDLFAINVTKMNRLELKKEFINFIQLQSDAKRIVSNFLEAYEFNITMHFLWTILAICGYLLLAQIELSEPKVDISALIAIVGQTIWTFVFIFIYCELGQKVSEAFDGPYDAICQFKLHLFPIEIQRMLLIIIVSAQQPVDLRGYGNFSCTRDRFKSVVNSGFSYFMMLRVK